MAVADNIKNMLALQGSRLAVKDNSPAQYASRKRQYLGDESAYFIEKYAKYSSDFVDAQVQGLDPTDFFAWKTKSMRLSDIVKPSAAITRKFDSYKQYLLADRSINYVPEGAKVVTMGSTWIVTNPANLSSVGADGIVQRCNATWNYLDFYGNIQKEPMVISKESVNASTNDFQEDMMMMRGYYNIIVQRNPATEQLDQNSRIFLGRRVWIIRGYSDFGQEFTGDDESRHIIYFSAQVSEPNPETDDFENQVANAYPFSWDVNVSGTSQLQVGASAQFSASSVRNGDEVQSTAENPISYLWSTSDETIATVDTAGLVTAVSEGDVVITATLEQNQSYSQNYAITVSGSIYGTASGKMISISDAAESPVVELSQDEEDLLHLTYILQGAPAPFVEGEVRFVDTPVAFIDAFETGTFSAAFYQNGEATQDSIAWTLTGADEEAYGFTAVDNTLTVFCWGGSVNPLVITAECNGKSATISVELRGI